MNFLKGLLLLFGLTSVSGVGVIVAGGPGRSDPYRWIYLDNGSDRAVEIATSFRENGRWRKWDRANVIDAKGRKRLSVFYKQYGEGELYRIGIWDEGSESCLQYVALDESDLISERWVLKVSRDRQGWKIEKVRW